jgi:hypothetical protein
MTPIYTANDPMQWEGSLKRDREETSEEASFDRPVKKSRIREAAKNSLKRSREEHSEKTSFDQPFKKLKVLEAKIGEKRKTREFDFSRENTREVKKPRNDQLDSSDAMDIGNFLDLQVRHSHDKRIDVLIMHLQGIDDKLKTTSTIQGSQEKLAMIAEDVTYLQSQNAIDPIRLDRINQLFAHIISFNRRF